MDVTDVLSKQRRKKLIIQRPTVRHYNSIHVSNFTVANSLQKLTLNSATCNSERVRKSRTIKSAEQAKENETSALNARGLCEIAFSPHRLVSWLFFFSCTEVPNTYTVIKLKYSTCSLWDLITVQISSILPLTSLLSAEQSCTQLWLQQLIPRDSLSTSITMSNNVLQSPSHISNHHLFKSSS